MPDVFLFFLLYFIFCLVWENNCRTNETNGNIAVKWLHQILIEAYNPNYPFQLTITDIFHMTGRKYIIYLDRYSDWTGVVSIHQAAKASTVCKILRKYFISFGVPEKVSCNNGPPYNCHALKTFLKAWDIRYRILSAHYPPTNDRTEAAVKYMKSIFKMNISPNGSLDIDEVVKAPPKHPTAWFGCIARRTTVWSFPKWLQIKLCQILSRMAGAHRSTREKPSTNVSQMQLNTFMTSI